jgi:predicted ATPase
LAALSRIHDLVLDDSQFVIATHSPILLSYPDARIYRCSAGELDTVACADTEQFQVMRDFLANPQRMLRVLLPR